MQGTEATFDEISFEGGDSARRVLQKLLPGAAAVALAGAIGVWALHLRDAANEERAVGPAPVAKPFADIVIDKRLASELTRAPQFWRPQVVARLETVLPSSSPPIPLPRLEAFPPLSPSRPASQAEGPPLPPARVAPEVGVSAPLPPPRPADLSAPQQASEPERRTGQPSVASTTPIGSYDNRNMLQKLFGIGQSSAPSAPAAAPPPAPVVASTGTARTAPAAATTAASGGTTIERSSTGLARGPMASLPPAFGNSAPTSGYDRQTAVYDISARTLYLPDGTKLEAHSGLGQALDNPSYVSQRAVGPTPPHLYQLTLREGSFHGVQAIRLNPIGEGGIYGRAGLLAHPFMLGPNGDSNGCVSVKDYEAFLRAYQNGQINKLVVVAKL